MKKLLITITGQERAERPSKEWLEDSNQQYLSQDPTKDRFIIKKYKNDDNKAIMEVMAQEPFSPIKRGLGDGLAVLKFPYDGGNGATELREGSKAQVRAYTDDTGEGIITEYNTLQEAKDYVNTLGESDGWIIIDEGVDSQVIDSYPSLHGINRLADEDGFIANMHNRVDNDRI